MAAWLRLILLSLIWGSSFILMKRGLFSPTGEVLFTGLQVGMLRIFTAFLALAPLAIYHFTKVDKKKIPLIIFSGLLGNGIPALLFAVAQTQISSSLSGILNSLTPFCTLLLGVLLFKVPLQKKSIWGVIIGLLGAAYLILSKGFGDSSNITYSLLVVIATFCYGANVNIIKEYLPEVKSLHISTISFTFTGLAALVYLLATQSFTAVLSTPEMTQGAIYIAILGVVGTGIALIIFNQLIKLTTAVFATSVTYLIPIVAIFWGIFDGETLAIDQWIASLVILSGIKIMRG